MTTITGNPYVGPRSFLEDDHDRFFGRDHEALDLLSTVIAERVVVFYAETGAGKTSLINTRLRPGLRKEHFLLLPTGRVSGELAPGVGPVDNIFVLNLLLRLDQAPRGGPERFAHMRLCDFLDGLTTFDGATYFFDADAATAPDTAGRQNVNMPPPHVLIVDQFEELFLQHPSRWPERADFFRQLDEALQTDPMLWVLFSMRQDYIAALDPYAHLIRGHLKDRFYMQRLDYDAALEAVRLPAANASRPFEPSVAEMLVDDLRQIRVPGTRVTQPGQFVEPVGLQVACYQLWESLEQKKPPAKSIQSTDVEVFGSVDRALADYYEQSVQHVMADAATKDLVAEANLRNWFSTKLITEAGTRGMVFRDDERGTTGGAPNVVIEALASRFLLRSELRAGGTWVELVHDRFVQPILEANRRFEAAHALGDVQQGSGEAQRAPGDELPAADGRAAAEGLPPAVGPAPAILLAYAADRDDRVIYLRNLSQEARGVRRALAAARKAGLCETIERFNTTMIDIARTFVDSRYQGRIVIFHFGGHEGSYGLLVQGAGETPADAAPPSLAAFLAVQRGLRLVFLSGCSTQNEAVALVDAGVPAVIFTAEDIADEAAAEFATRFYQGLAGGSSVEQAFNLATVVVRSSFAGAETPSWQLHVQHGNEEAARWSLASAAWDPLFGLPALPALPPLALPSDPFRYLTTYAAQDAQIFFGRDREIRELYMRVTDSADRGVILLYGATGVGKSSLLQAGLLPRLEAVCTCYYRRRDRATGLTELLCDLFDVPTRSDRAADDTAWRLAAAWHAREAADNKPLVVMIDQLEEVFTRPRADDPDDLATFVTVLGAIFSASERPRGAILLCFRKEWLPEIQVQFSKQQVPSVRQYLGALSAEGIAGVVTGITRTEVLRAYYGLVVEEGLPELIAHDMSSDPNSPIAPTLQVLLQKMWEAANQRNLERPVFSTELYESLRREGLLLEDFLRRQLTALGQLLPGEAASGLALDLLNFHTTALGTAGERTLNEIRQTYAHVDSSLPALLQACRDLYLLVEPATEQLNEQPVSRLTSDALTPLVRRAYAESTLPGQQARRLLESRAFAPELVDQDALLDDRELSIVERGLAGMRDLTAAEAQLVSVSVQERGRRARLRQMLVWAALFSLLLNIVLLLWLLLN